MEWDIFLNVFVRCGKIYFSTVYRYIYTLLAPSRRHRLPGSSGTRLRPIQLSRDPAGLPPGLMLARVGERGVSELGGWCWESVVRRAPRCSPREGWKT